MEELWSSQVIRLGAKPALPLRIMDIMGMYKNLYFKS
jgi:hypothetical protein